MHPILNAIHKNGDIYQNPPSAEPSLDGWGGNDPIFDRLIRLVKPTVVIEVGTWKGQSAITMGKACQQAGLADTAIICVDTWLGSEEHWITWPDQLKLTHGYPALYPTFLANVIEHKLTEVIVPLPTTSIAASSILAHYGVRASLIYIDANHQTDAVLSDLASFTPLLTDGGTIFGHDISCAAVREAVDEHYGEGTYRIEGDFWIKS